ncbi:MAG: UvrD-helicase domain-containing protein [bacterium]
MLKKITLIGEQKNVLFLSPKNPIQIKGVAGSGKTTVALYRAKHLLETENNLFQEAKIAIFTFNKTLAAYIREVSPYINGGYKKNSEEINPTTPEGLKVKIINFHQWAYHFLKEQGNPLYDIDVDGERIYKTIKDYKKKEIIELCKSKFNEYSIAQKSVEFFSDEISWIKGKLFKNKEEYLEAERRGRGTADRVIKKDKEIIWEIYKEYQKELKERDKVDFDDYAILSLETIERNSDFTPPFTHIIIDEAQDLTKAQILTINKLVSDETQSLTIIADAAQRIYKSGFIWKEVGINVRGGRTIELKKNYRNTIQIASAATSLLDKENDKSEFTELINAKREGAKPKLGNFTNKNDQFEFLNKELKYLLNKELIGDTVILHRTNEGVQKIKRFLSQNKYRIEIIKSNNPVEYDNDSIKICTMSSIKGLEFDNVFILDLNEDIIPFPPGFIEEDDEHHISTERRLLYTCMTRARDRLYLISSSEPTRYLYEIDEDLLDEIDYQPVNTNNDYDGDDLPF